MGCLVSTLQYVDVCQYNILKYTDDTILLTYENDHKPLTFHPFFVKYHSKLITNIKFSNYFYGLYHDGKIIYVIYDSKRNKIYKCPDVTESITGYIKR